jgi:segregation and condensation protein B
MNEVKTRAAEAAVEDPDAPVTVDESGTEDIASHADTDVADETGAGGKTVVVSDAAVEDPDSPVTVEESATEDIAGDAETDVADETGAGHQTVIVSDAAVEDPDAPVVLEGDPDPQDLQHPDRPEPPREEPGEDEPPVQEPPPDEPDDAPPPVEEPPETMSADQLLGATEQPDADAEEHRKLAILEAIVYVTDEPLSREQIAKALGEPLPYVSQLLDKLVDEYNRPFHGLTVREVAGGFKMATKPEHHEAVRTFVKNLNPPLKLSLAALETLAVIAYKQPITAPEIMEIRGVQGAGVLKTLIDRKLITTAGRKNVVGKPILYKTTKEFLVQFGLRDLAELPTLKEFEDLRRMAFSEAETPSDVVDGTPVAEPASGSANE